MLCPRHVSCTQSVTTIVGCSVVECTDIANEVTSLAKPAEHSLSSCLGIESACQCSQCCYNGAQTRGVFSVYMCGIVVMYEWALHSRNRSGG